jgi:drug/metabolite transporter (DMT)-like permease
MLGMLGVSGRVLAATLLSVATAFLYSLSNVLEMLEAEQVPDEYALRFGLLKRLIKRPRWLLGLGSDFVGFGTQAAALGLAAVVFVEPILASGILMALFLGAAFTHKPVQRSDLFAALVLSAGLAVFLYEVSPTGGVEVGERGRWLVAGPIAAAVIVVSMTVGRNTTGPWRAAFVGVAAGISFGVSAVLTKTLVHYIGDGVFAWVNHWEPYALALFAVGGVVLTQSALQTGALGAAVGAQEAMAPISAAILGLVLLHEEVAATNGIQIFLVSCSIASVIVGIGMLARAEERMMGDIARRRAEGVTPATPHSAQGRVSR